MAGETMQPAAQANGQISDQAATNLILHGGGPFAPAIDTVQEITGFPAPTLGATLGQGGVGATYAIYARPVGLVKRLIIEWNAVVTAGATSVQNLTKNGVANFFSQVALYDLSNYRRILTAGWHLQLRSSIMRRAPFGTSALIQPACGYGQNIWSSFQAPASIAPNGTGKISGIVEIPISVSDDDLTGVIYASVVQASILLQPTINPSLFCSSTADPTLSMYQSAGSDLASIGTVNVRVYQNYLDHLPAQRTQQGATVPILPQASMGQALLLEQSQTPNMVVGDNTIQFTNSRKYQSLAIIYDNDGVLNTGSDVSFIEVNSANLTPVKKLDPILQSFAARTLLKADLPPGMYYLDFRRRPINTNQSGNFYADINASAVTTGALCYLGFESTAVLGLVNAAGAIPSGA
jgi:hypothetical protein